MPHSSGSFGPRLPGEQHARSRPTCHRCRWCPGGRCGGRGPGRGCRAGRPREVVSPFGHSGALWAQVRHFSVHFARIVHGTCAQSEDGYRWARMGSVCSVRRRMTCAEWGRRVPGVLGKPSPGPHLPASHHQAQETHSSDGLHRPQGYPVVPGHRYIHLVSRENGTPRHMSFTVDSCLALSSPTCCVMPPWGTGPRSRCCGGTCTRPCSVICGYQPGIPPKTWLARCGLRSPGGSAASVAVSLSSAAGCSPWPAGG